MIHPLRSVVVCSKEGRVQRTVMLLLAIHNGGEGLRVVERLSLARFQTLLGLAGLMEYLSSIQGASCLHDNNPNTRSEFFSDGLRSR